MQIIKSGLQCDKDAYRTVRDAYSALLNETRKKTYYSDLINECTGDAKNWVVSYCKLSDQRTSSHGVTSTWRSSWPANKFGDFFYKKINFVKTEIDSISVGPPDVHFSSISEDEIQKIICKPSNASCQLDPIPMWLVKLCCDELVPVLSKMANLSVKEMYLIIAKQHWFYLF